MSCSGIKEILHEAEIDSYVSALSLMHDGKISHEFFTANWYHGELCSACDKRRGEEKWPDVNRLTLAMNLSPTTDVFEDLMLGRYVDPARLDQEWLRWAKREKFVALKPAIECL